MRSQRDGIGSDLFFFTMGEEKGRDFSYLKFICDFHMGGYGESLSCFISFRAIFPS